MHVDDSTIQSSCAVLCRDHCVSIPAPAHDPGPWASLHRKPGISASIMAIEGRPRLSTAVGIRPQPSLPSTAVSSCSFPSTAATVVRGRPQPSRPSTAIIAVHGCPRLLRPPTAVGRPADWLTRVTLKMLTRCRPFYHFSVDGALGNGIQSILSSQNRCSQNVNPVSTVLIIFAQMFR